MNYSIVFNGEKEKVLMKDAFADVLAKIAASDPKFVYLDADLMNAIGTKKWADAHPGQAINVGIAESNMAGLAAGLSASGLKPLTHTFGCFSSRRAFDQAFLSIGYAKNSVVMVGSDPGVTATFNGGTHMPFEDMALYRAVPGGTVIEITDSVMLDSLLPKLIDLPGVKYVRLGRKEATAVYAPGSDFEVGKAAVLWDGQDVAILALGIMVGEAMKAAERLAAEGISAAVLDLYSVKPIDADQVVAYAKKCGAVVTAENHNVIGGLTSAVSELLGRLCPTPIEAVAVNDEFGEVGPQDYLQQRFGLTADHVVEQAKAVIARKK